MRKGWIAGVAAVGLVASVASAGITGISLVDDGKGGITEVKTDPVVLAPPEDGIVKEGTIVAYGKQQGTGACLQFGVTTDTEEDPIVNSVQSVVNDTGFTWSSFILNVYMNKPFTLLSGTGPANWTVQPIPESEGLFFDGDGSLWTSKATVNFTSQGRPYDIHVGDGGQFGARFSFVGASNYGIELISVAPEPATLALLALGAVFVRRARR
jgi:hypothetical protein